MSSTALGAERAIIFISDAHEKFYYEKLKEVRYQDVYHKALVYCLGISDDTRRNIKSIYDFKTGNVKTKCLHEGWQTSGSVKVVRMAFNLYCNGTPSVLDYDDAEEQVDECRMYTVEELFCCAYAPYFWQAVQIRYPVCTVDVSSERPLPCSPLPSTGITRLPWYYETIRLPATHPLVSIF